MLTKLIFSLCVALCAGVLAAEEMSEIELLHDMMVEPGYIGYNASYNLIYRTSAWAGTIRYHFENQGYQLTGSNSHALENVADRRKLSNIEATNNLVDLMKTEAESLGVNISTCVQPYTDFLLNDARSLYLEGQKCDRTYKEFLESTLRKFDEFLWEMGNTSKASASMIEACYQFPEDLILSCRKTVEPMAYEIYNEQVIELVTLWRQERVYFNESKMKFIDCSIRLTDKKVKKLRQVVDGVGKCAEQLMDAARKV